MVLRTLLDHLGLGCVVNGTIQMSITMSHPNTVTENGLTLELPSPTVTQIVPWYIVV
jgi:hypothetical protein